MFNPTVDYQSVLQDLRERRKHAAATVTHLDSAIAGIEQIIRELKIDQSNIADGAAPVSGIYRKMTLKDASIHLLRSSGKGMSTSDVVQGLRNGGIKSKSKNLYTTVYNTLVAAGKVENPKIIRGEDKLWKFHDLAQLE